MNPRLAGWGRTQASPAERMALARDYVRKHAPYFSKVLYGLTFVAVPGLGTLGTTKTLVCGYDPDYVMANDPEVVAADIAHEIMHVLGHHFDRLAWCKDRYRANIAADLPINQSLRKAMHAGKPIWCLHHTAEMPENHGLPEGKTAEQYYQLLEQQSAAQKKPKVGLGQQPSGSGDGQGQGQGSNQSQNGAAGPSNQQRPGGAGGQLGSRGRGVAAGHCGSIAGNEDHPALAGVAGRSEVEKRALVMQVAKAIKEHVAQHGRGSVPETLIDMVEMRGGRAKRDWKRELAIIVRNCSGRIQSGGDDYSLSRPSKRSFLRGMIRPGLIENMPVVAIVLDSSASMGVQQILAALIEAVAILKALGVDEFWFAQADAAMAMQFTLVNATFLKKLKVIGRGGTDFRPAFAAVQKLNPRPDLLIYGTDGDGYAPRNAPRGIATVWCVVPSSYNRRPALWGHAVLATDDPNEQLRPPHIPPDDRAA